MEQCRNSYGRIARRLEAAGYGDDCVVWIENFTSGQHWRLERMALWPEYFGEENHQRAVSFGVQTRMDGLNMLTSIVMAIDPALQRRVAVPAPHRGRASRCTRVGPFTFVIGVRGTTTSYTNVPAPEETGDSFDVQLDYRDTTRSSRTSSTTTTSSRTSSALDCGLRAARFVPRYEAGRATASADSLPFASYAIGFPLGGNNEQELGGIAIIPGEPKSQLVVGRSRSRRLDGRRRPGLRAQRLGACATSACTRPARSLRETHEQVRRAVSNLETLARPKPGRASTALLRLDVFLRDIYAADEVLEELSAILGAAVPAMTFLGCEPRTRPRSR